MIESKIDKALASQISVAGGGVTFSTMNDVMEFAKMMAVSKLAVPPLLRDQVGVCLAVTIQAIEWRMSPFAVASKAYMVNDKLAYESQLIHAVIEHRAPIIGRLKHSYIGEGDKRQCKVWALVRGEDTPLEYTSPYISAITPKNSPLWKSKPDLQLYYNTSRDWARVYFPDVIMGVYSDDEIEAISEVNPSHGKASSRTQRLVDRLGDLSPSRDTPIVETDLQEVEQQPLQTQTTGDFAMASSPQDA